MKTETLSNKGFFIMNTLEILEHLILPREHGFCCHRSTVAVNRLWSLKSLNRELSLSASVGVDVSSAPQQGTGNIVWLLPSLRSFQVYAFVSSCGTARKRKTGDTVVFTFENSTKCRLIFQVNFFYNLLVANWRLSSKLQSPNIFFTCHGDQYCRSVVR